MDKYRYFTVFSMITFGSRDTLDHSISPLIGTIQGLDELKGNIFSNLKEKPIEAPKDILKSLDFETFEKVRIGYHSVGLSLIICCSEMIKKIANDRVLTNNHFSLKPQKIFEVYKLGPKVNGVPWAEGVVCASNYVRHDDEWQALIKPSAKQEDGVSFNISYESIDWDAQVGAFPEDPKRNVSVINAIGVPYEAFLKHHSMAGLEIAKALYLFEKDIALDLFNHWITTVVEDLQSHLGIK